MKKIATLLMKELNYLKKEAAKLQQEDVDLSNVPLNENMQAIYDTGYVYENNRAKIKQIHEEELKIKSALARFNSVTKVMGLDITIAEALVRIGQIKSEIDALTYLANQAEYVECRKHNIYGNEVSSVRKINYSKERVSQDLEALRKELTAIQIAIDKTNLTSEVEY